MKIEEMFVRMLAGPGAVRETLHMVVGGRARKNPDKYIFEEEQT